MEQEGVVGPAGNDQEMRTVGGELAFITAMILDSLILRERYSMHLPTVAHCYC